MSKGKFHEFEEIPCSFRLKKVIQTMTIATFLCVRRVEIVIYLHIEGALYAQKSVPSWFLAVFDSKIDVC